MTARPLQKKVVEKGTKLLRVLSWEEQSDENGKTKKKLPQE